MKGLSVFVIVVLSFDRRRGARPMYSSTAVLYSLSKLDLENLRNEYGIQ